MKIAQNYYLIVDLEATCADDKSIPRHRMEIIEIGAVLLNATSLQIDDEFQSFVRPTLNPTLTDFCKTLTTIPQAAVDQAPIFPQALKQFQDWLYPFGSYLFCSWGDYDKYQFRRDCRYYRVGYPFPGGHLNLKRAFSLALDTPKKFGMKGALSKLGLSVMGTHHRGIDDARNIARIIAAVMANGDQCCSDKLS